MRKVGIFLFTFIFFFFSVDALAAKSMPKGEVIYNSNEPNADSLAESRAKCGNLTGKKLAICMKQFGKSSDFK